MGGTNDGAYGTEDSALRGSVNILAVIGMLTVLCLPALVVQAMQDGPPASRPADAGLAAVEPAKLFSKADGQRLMIAEYDPHGDAEPIPVRIRKPRSGPSFEELVLPDIREAVGFEPAWERTLRTGTPFEKMQVVLRATGLKHADWFEVRGEPAVLSKFRRQVLPLIEKGCARSGCHGGSEGYAFRLPDKRRRSRPYAHTVFHLLTQMHTEDRPMIDRANPQGSTLLRFMLPGLDGDAQHPPVPDGHVRPVLNGERDARYQKIIAWIESLREPAPEVEFAYEPPAWLGDFAPPTYAETEPGSVEP